MGAESTKGLATCPPTPCTLWLRGLLSQGHGWQPSDLAKMFGSTSKYWFLPIAPRIWFFAVFQDCMGAKREQMTFGFCPSLYAWCCLVRGFDLAAQHQILATRDTLRAPHPRVPSARLRHWPPRSRCHSGVLPPASGQRSVRPGRCAVQGRRQSRRRPRRHRRRAGRQSPLNGAFSGGCRREVRALVEPTEQGQPVRITRLILSLNVRSFLSQPCRERTLRQRGLYAAYVL
jgi:hypothetical protein